VPGEKVGEKVGVCRAPAKRMGGGMIGGRVGCGGVTMVTAAALVAWRCTLATSRLAGLWSLQPCLPLCLWPMLWALAPGRSVPRVRVNNARMQHCSLELESSRDCLA